MNESELDANIRLGRAGGSEDASDVISAVVPCVAGAWRSRLGFLVGYGCGDSDMVPAEGLAAAFGSSGNALSVGVELGSGATGTSALACGGVDSATVAVFGSSSL